MTSNHTYRVLAALDGKHIFGSVDETTREAALAAIKRDPRDLDHASVLELDTAGHLVATHYVDLGSMEFTRTWLVAEQRYAPAEEAQ